MLTSVSVEQQLGQVQDDPLRVLIVGAGVAGLTLAQLLRAQGLNPVLVERESAAADEGYMLGLLPLVDSAISHIGVQRAYRQRSMSLHRYQVRGRHGQVLREYELGELFNNFGDYRGIARGALLQALAESGAPVSYAATLKAATATDDAVAAILQDGSAKPEHEIDAEFDLVVAADGIHSSTRGLILRPDQVTTYDSGWGGWVTWMNGDPAQADLYEEIWGAGFFVGAYPVKDRVGVFIGGDQRDTRHGAQHFVERIRADLSAPGARMTRAIDALAASVEPYYWHLADCRSAVWSVGRTVLLGDAAAGFLPTAGVGAAMAMESAGVLAARLTGASRTAVPQVLRDYERTQRPRVEAAQDNSRTLARLMFHRSRALAAVRDAITPHITLKRALGPIRTLLENAPQD